MASKLASRLSRISTGLTAFVASGMLVYSILSNNGGADNSQLEWQEASKRAIEIQRNGGSYIDELIQNKAPQYIDQTVTGSIISEEEEVGTEEISEVEELSVLALIRKNSDVAPGVSSGTARVSIVIKDGDTLFNISQRHGISVPDLARLNGLSEPYTIKIGQTLYVAR